MKLCVAILLFGLTITVALSIAQPARTVRLDVQVIDQSTGKIAELLGPGDFEVFDDGRRVPIQRLRIDTPPLDLAIVLYTSSSGLTSPSERRSYSDGVAAAVKLLRSEDRAAVIRGASANGISLQFTNEANLITKALTSGPQLDRDRLFDAVSRALSLFAPQSSPDRQRAIIAITDDIERHSEISREVLETNLLTSSVTLHEVMLALRPAAPGIYTHPQKKGGGLPLPIPQIGGIIHPRPAGGSSLVPIVRATGGEYPVGNEFDATFPALISRLRLRYQLEIAVPRAEKAFHEIRVKLTPEKQRESPAAKVNSRIGYYSEP